MGNIVVVLLGRIRPLLFWLIQLLYPDNPIREHVRKVYCTVGQFVKIVEQIYFIKLVNHTSLTAGVSNRLWYKGKYIFAAQ